MLMILYIIVILNSEIVDSILPILKEMGIDKLNMPMEKNILEYTKPVNEISYDTIKEDMKSYLDMLM